MEIKTKSPSFGIGNLIAQEKASHWIEEFKKNFPKEKNSISLNTSLLKQTISLDEGIVGIRFLYGMKDMSKKDSLILILMPCIENYKNTSPTTLFTKNGVMTSDGEFLELAQVLGYVTNYVATFFDYLPNSHYTKIIRGHFIGKDTLLDIIHYSKNNFCRYSFGYNSEKVSSSENLIAVIETQNIYNTTNSYSEFWPCPPHCGDGDDDCIASKLTTNIESENSEVVLNGYRHFRDNWMQIDKKYDDTVELYYHLSPSLITTIEKRTDKELIYKEIYSQHILPLKNLLKEEKFAEAKSFFKLSIYHLLNRYILS